MMKTLKVGIAGYEQYKNRTMAIARGEIKPRAGEPKVWFTSIESFARVLSDKNRELLSMIAETEPGSMNELAQKNWPGALQSLPDAAHHGALWPRSFREGRGSAAR